MALILRAAIIHEAHKLFHEAVGEIEEARQWDAPTHFAGAYERHGIEVLRSVAEHTGDNDLKYELNGLILEILNRR